MSEENNRAVMGGNNPPPLDPAVHEQAKQLAQSILARADEVAAKGDIRDAEHAGIVADMINALRSTFKQVDGMRADQKKPHDDAAAAVQKAFKVFLDALESSAKKHKDLSGKWLIAEQQRMAAEQRAREEAARVKAREAEEAAQLAAARGDTLAEAQAAEQFREAEKEATKAAKPAANARMESATGAGRGVSLRTIKVAIIDNQNAAYMHFRDRPEVRDVIQRLSNEGVRAKDYAEGSIPGVRSDVQQSAA